MSLQVKEPSARLSILRRDQVEAMTGLSRAAIYDAIKRGAFPKQIPLIPGGKSVGWLAHEVAGWISSRVAARDAGKAVHQ